MSEQQDVVDGLRSKSVTYGDGINGLKDRVKAMDAATRASFLKLEEALKENKSEGSVGTKQGKARDILDPKLMAVDTFNGGEGKSDSWRNDLK